MNGIERVRVAADVAVSSGLIRRSDADAIMACFVDLGNDVIHLDNSKLNRRQVRALDLLYLMVLDANSMAVQ